MHIKLLNTKTSVYIDHKLDVLEIETFSLVLTVSWGRHNYKDKIVFVPIFCPI